MSTGKYWDKAWSLVDGCTRVSEGCQNCWLKEMDKRFHPENLAKVEAKPERLEEPLHRRKTTIHAVWSDLFHKDVSDDFIDRAFAFMASASRHVFLILTKRPERMQQYITRVENSAPQAAKRYATALRDHFERYKKEFREGYSLPEPPTPQLRFIYDSAARQENRPTNPDGTTLYCGFSGGEYHWRQWPLSNVYLGVTAENQEQADKRIPILLQIPAAHRFVSIEPMLSAINIDQYLRCPVCGYTPYDVGLHMDHRLCKGPGPGLSWVVLGGETGHGARPMHPDWVRSVRDQCVSARVPFFFKSWGEWKPIARCYEERECPDQPGVIDGDWPLSEVADWENQAKEIIALEPSGDIPHWSHRDKYFVHYQPSPNAYWMVRAGKKKAGRLLDGREWNEVPW